MYKPLASVILLALMSSSAFSDNLYRYKNNVGGTVVDWHVPAEYAGRGYEVLNAQGEVVEVVPRQLSAEELQNKDLVERLRQDAEVERALHELKIRLSILASSQRVSRSRLESLLARVADTERRGDAPLEQDVDAIAALRTEIASTGRAIEERKAQVLEVTQDYRQDRDRFEQLQDVVLLRRSLSRDQSTTPAID